MLILGVDPGLTTVGLGLVEKSTRGDVKALDWLTIETPKAMPLAERLAELKNDLQTFISETKPDLAIVEKIFFAKNKKTAIQTAQARGVILSTLVESGIEVIEVTPLQLKTAIAGDGRADKKQMQTMVVRTLKLKETPTPADAADALAMALYGAFTQR